MTINTHTHTQTGKQSKLMTGWCKLPIAGRHRIISLL